ncbi:N-6 DNA methylase [Pseudomonas sp. NA13]
MPLGSKKADLMFLQHMLAVTRDEGMIATVLPHGVLFRGGEERGIRAGIIENDLLEAVIGLPANLFYGTGIPACILILRQQSRKAPTVSAPSLPNARESAVYQRRPRVLRGPCAELSAARAHRENHHRLRRISPDRWS